MAQLTYDSVFWDEVAYHLLCDNGLHRDDEPLDPETLYVLSREVGLGVDDAGVNHLVSWGPKYTADRLHRRLGLR
jgi:hypothetical protein